MRLPRPPALSTMAIGSLPHTQLELAMQQALTLDVPTLPQLPRANSAEFMVPEALEGLPGMTFDAEGRTSVDVARWREGAREFGERLDRALKGEGLEAFEPAGTFCRAWRPFLWEVEQRRIAFAKAQVAGPLTTAWATTTSDGGRVSDVPGLGVQIVRLVVARALAMTAALQAAGATPLVFFDEPGLYAFDKRRPSHVVELAELRLAIAALKKAGALVGVHCCGNTDWASVLALGADIVSADVRLSLAPLLATGRALDEYLAAGGWLGLGIVPTGEATRTDPAQLVDSALEAMGDRRRQILSRALLSPACGLALHTVPESQQVDADLREAQRLLRSA